jgi:hypothetical protein
MSLVGLNQSIVDKNSTTSGAEVSAGVFLNALLASSKNTDYGLGITLKLAMKWLVLAKLA